MCKTLVVFVLIAVFGMAAPASLERAEARYEKADYEGAIEALKDANSANGAALALKGKALFKQGKYRAAIKALERAVAVEPNNAGYWNWLGKAYGRQAENAIFFRAIGWAKKCGRAFSRSVELDAGNLDALSNLFEFYKDAPGFLGGGSAKAAALVPRIGKVSRAEEQFARAELAESRKDFQAAERHLRKAIQLEPNEVGRVLDLARFLARRKRYAESDRLFAEAAARKPVEARVLYARAAAWVESGRRLDEARSSLEEYLSSELTPEDAPRREAEKLLRKARRN